MLANVLLVAVIVGAVFTARRAPGQTPDIQPPPGQTPDFEIGRFLDFELPTWTDIDDGFMPTADPYQDTMPDQIATPIENFSVAAFSLLDFEPMLNPDIHESAPVANERAFLDLIAYAEGTAGPNGYRTLFGGGLFEDMRDHPRIYAPFTDQKGRKLRTSAAGRYQFLARTWDELADRLRLPDFGPESQDRGALELIRERGALADVRAGRIPSAVRKVAKVWASLPGAGYSQREREMSKLIASYSAAGGILET